MQSNRLRKHRMTNSAVAVRVAIAALVTACPHRAQGLTIANVVAALFPPPIQLQADLNHDAKVNSADVVAAVAQAVATPTHTPTATPSFTSTVTSSPTPTPSPSSTPSATPTLTPPGLVFAGPLSQLIPHGVGDKFVYNVTRDGKQLVQTSTIMSSSAGTFLVDMVEGSEHQAETYSDNDNEIRSLNVYDYAQAGRTTCTPGLLRLVTPLVIGQQYATTSTCVITNQNGDFGGEYTASETYTVVEVVGSITVPAGTFTSVIHLSGESTLTFSPVAHATTFHGVWIKPGVGILRHTVAPAAVAELEELANATINGHSIHP